jgi:hypothetical protein
VTGLHLDVLMTHQMTLKAAMTKPPCSKERGDNYQSNPEDDGEDISNAEKR